MPQSLRHRLKNLVRKGLLSEQDLERIVIIPIDATNGDVIKAMFPNGKIIKTEDGDCGYEIYLDDTYSFCSWFDGLWWNAKFER